MTHEEFIGLKPEDGPLSYADRKAVENTLSWQSYQLRQAMGRVGTAIVEAIRDGFRLTRKEVSQ